jgi:hypothetical protein
VMITNNLSSNLSPCNLLSNKNNIIQIITKNIQIIKTIFIYKQ